jgi:hypothetical protein
MGNIKHWLAILCSFTLFLTACSDATSVESTDPKEDETQEEAVNQLSVEEILQQSIKAMESVSSLKTEMNMLQEMALPNEESYSTNMLIYMEITQEPLNMYQKITMEFPEIGEMETELYMLEDAFYYKDPMENKWFTYPEEIASQLREMEDTQISTDEQLELLLKNAEHLSFTEDDDHYIVTVEAAPNILHSFAQELNGLVHDNMAGDIDQLMLMSDIKDLDYTLYIDKKTFMQTKMDMSMAFELTTDGEAVKISTSTQAIFKDFNAITEIQVPEKITKQAEEYNPDYSGVGEMEDFDLDSFDEFDVIVDEEEMGE